MTTATTTISLAPSTLADAEAGVQSATNLVHAAAAELSNLLAQDDSELTIDGAKHRFALAARLADNLVAVQTLIGEMRSDAEAVIIATYPHGTNVDVEGSMFHRYDETRSNSVSYKTLYEQAYSYLDGAKKGVLTKMEAAQKAGSKTYKRLKPGPFKGKK